MATKNGRFSCVHHIPPSERYDRHANSGDLPESLILQAILEFGLNPGEVQATRLSGGFQNSNYVIHDSQRNLVFRFYANGVDTAQREIGLLYLLQNQDVKTPRPAGLFTVGGRYVGVLEFIDGTHLQDHLTKGNLRPEQFSGLGRELAKIHRVEFDRCGFFGPQGQIGEEFENFPGLARQYMDKVLENLPADRLEPTVTVRVQRLLREKWALVEETEPSRRLHPLRFQPEKPNGGVWTLRSWPYSIGSSACRAMDISTSEILSGSCLITPRARAKPLSQATRRWLAEFTRAGSRSPGSSI